MLYSNTLEVEDTFGNGNLLLTTIYKTNNV